MIPGVFGLDSLYLLKFSVECQILEVAKVEKRSNSVTSVPFLLILIVLLSNQGFEGIRLGSKVQFCRFYSFISSIFWPRIDCSFKNILGFSPYATCFPNYRHTILLRLGSFIIYLAICSSLWRFLICSSSLLIKASLILISVSTSWLNDSNFCLVCQYFTILSFS